MNIATRSNLFRHHCHVVTTIYAKLEHENFRREKVLKKCKWSIHAFSCLTIHTHLLSKAKAEQPDTEDSNPGGLCTVHSNRFRGGQGIQDRAWSQGQKAGSVNGQK